MLRAGDIVKAFPDLKAGDILKIHRDDLGGVDVGQFVVIQKSGAKELDFTLLLADEADEATGSADEVGTRVSLVDESAVTLEVMSPPEGGREA
ncbi:hypothetical protein AB0F43_26820 [Kribbella sp. NPDC023972]|uniref:hypothetical protein n=1 Tax=Kribbella sp. NPDC023972 TaxID=3154795 RepID=UPI0033D94620